MKIASIICMLLFFAIRESPATENIYNIGRLSFTTEQIAFTSRPLIKEETLSMLSYSYSVYSPAITTGKQSGIGAEFGAGTAISFSEARTVGLFYGDAALLYKFGTNANPVSFTRFGYGLGFAGRVLFFSTGDDGIFSEDDLLGTIWPGLQVEISYEVLGLTRLRILYFFETAGMSLNPGSGFEISLSVIPLYDL